MKNIEKYISPLIESQFPSFYRDEGTQFVAFIKAYYEWMESENNPLWYARRLSDIRDIDTTLDDFLVYFKEKYLKNIQFDTSTNKKLLIKNSLELYRSKGSERSIDLFFKLVYGTNADVKYPAENIFRASDGNWEVPLYLEVTYSKYNVNYVGKQIIGSNSGAKAFVERYIRRKSGYGYVNILYISNIQGAFQNNDRIGIVVNGQPVFNENQNCKLLGSVTRVEIITKGKNFKVGDIVRFEDSVRGKGGLARVAEVSSATGTVDFLLEEGGYGYTLSATPLISEKVISLNGITASTSSDKLFSVFETVAEPLITLTYTTLTGSVSVGDTLNRYNGATLVGSGKVLRVTTTDTGGEVIISHSNGTFTSPNTYYVSGNASYFTSTSMVDETVAADIMASPDQYILTVDNLNVTVGDTVYQATAEKVIGSGTVYSVAGNTVTLTDIDGVFKTTEFLKSDTDSSYSANVSNIYTTAGVYNISKNVQYITYSGANNNTILDTKKIYRYNARLNTTLAEGLVVTATYSAGAGNLTIIPLKGDFVDATTIYTDSNTAYATVSVVGVETDGADFQISDNAKLISLTNNTYCTPVAASTGYGASFEIGTIGETEVIFINTDLIKANNVSYLDFYRKTISVGATTGFEIGDHVYQELNKIQFSATNNITPSSGFIAIPTANSRFNPGDIVQYTFGSGNTAINGLDANGYYIVYQSNTTGLILTYGNPNNVAISNTNYTDFANNTASAGNGHFLAKFAYGTVFANTTTISVKDIRGTFGATAAGGNTSTYGNSNLILYSNTSTNTSISSTSSYSTVQTTSRKYRKLAARSAAYGFPKNPQGGFGDKIYSCLNFGRYELGTIGSLTGINPGVDYNADPYVLAYEPAIAGFNRKDYVMTISNPTGSFIVGERIQQTPSTLAFYDLQVSEGAYGNTYTEVVRNLDAFLEVDSGNDFIYIPDTIVTVNSTDDVSNNDFISIPGNVFTANQLIRYSTTGGNTAISGLSNATIYYVNYSNSTGVTLKTTTGGSNVNLTGANIVTFNSLSGIDSTNNVITLSSNPFTVGQTVRYYTDSNVTPLTGLSNTSIYYVVYSSGSNVALSTSLGGSNVDITALSSGSSNNYLRYYNSGFTGHSFTRYYNPYSNNQKLVYRSVSGSTVISGLTNNSIYYVVSANTVGIKLSLTNGGSVVGVNAAGATSLGHYFSTIPGYLPKDAVYQTVTKTFNSNTAVDSTNDAILLSPQPYRDGDRILYFTNSGNTVVTGLSNNSYYYVYGSNTTAIQLKTSLGDLTVVGINATAVSETGHNLSAVATGTVSSVYVDGSNGYVRVSNLTNSFANSYILYSNTNVNVSGTVNSVSLSSTTSTADGIVKLGSNNTTLYVKRISFENTFSNNLPIVGESSGTSATIQNIREQQRLPYQIGLNAVIDANVATANGQVSSLQVTDSGLGYGNGEIISFVSSDGSREGSAKVILNGRGKGSGYYKTSKGFLSEDMYIHDGDYYQEYSYEVVSKLSVDRYSDMFKKVMHVAGTKFFGSVAVIEDSSIDIEFKELSKGDEISFNSSTGVISNAIYLNIEKENRYFNSLTSVNDALNFISVVNNPFVDGDLVKYYTDSGNTIISGLSNNGFYYVVGGNTTGVQLSSTLGGSVINITPGISEIGHYLLSYTNPFSNGDVVSYSFATGNTPLTISLSSQFNINTAITNNFIANASNKISNNHEITITYTSLQNVLPGLYWEFNANTDIKVGNNGYISLANNPFRVGDQVKYYTATGNTAITGLANNTNYYVSFANTSALRLSTSNTTDTYSLSNTNVLANGYFYVADTDSATPSIAGIYFKPEGDKMYVVDSWNDYVTQYKLRTPWQVNTAVQETNLKLTTYTLTPQNLYISPDGRSLYVVSYGGKVFEFKMRKKWDVSTAVHMANLDITSVVGVGSNAIRSVKFNNDGTGMYIANTANYIAKYDLATPWRINTAVYNSNNITLPGGGNLNDFVFSNDGYRLYKTSTAWYLRSFTLSTAWDIRTISVADTPFKYFGDTTNTTSWSLYLKPDNSRFYIHGRNNNYVYEYDWFFANPSTINESGHRLLKTSFYAREANTSGLKLSLRPSGPILNLTPSTVSTTHTLSVTKLSNTATYYVVNTTPNTVKLTTFQGNTAINITAGSSEVGHYLSKMTEENS